MTNRKTSGLDLMEETIGLNSVLYHTVHRRSCFWLASKYGVKHKWFNPFVVNCILFCSLREEMSYLTMGWLTIGICFSWDEWQVVFLCDFVSHLSQQSKNNLKQVNLAIIYFSLWISGTDGIFCFSKNRANSNRHCYLNFMKFS